MSTRRPQLRDSWATQVNLTSVLVHRAATYCRKRRTKRHINLLVSLFVAVSMLLGYFDPGISAGASTPIGPATPTSNNVAGLAAQTDESSNNEAEPEVGVQVPPADYTITSPTPAPKVTAIPDTNYEDQAIDRRRDALLAAVNNLPAVSHGTEGADVNTKSGGKVKSQDGGITIGMMPGAKADAATLNVQAKRVKATKGDPKTTRNGRPLAYHYELTATRGKGGQKVEKFDKEVVLVWNIDPKELAAQGIRGFPLIIYTYNEQSQDWEEVPSMWNPQTNQLVVVTSHFSVWGADTAFDSLKNYLPSVNSFEVNLQSGTSSVEYPINMPDGPGGLSPQVSLSYNSGSIDRVATNQQGSSTIGWGWTLSTSYIAATQHHWGSCDSSDPQYPGHHPWTASIVVNDIKGDLVKGTDGYWHTADQTFARIEYIQGSTGITRTTDSWVVYALNGTKYEFDQNALITDDCVAPKGRTSYKWMLSRATDVHGNVINYSYKWQDGSTTEDPLTLKNQEPAAINPSVPDKTLAVYPYQITYGAGGDKVRVTFDVVARRMGGVLDVTIDDQDNTFPRLGLYQKFRINKVTVERKQESTGLYSVLRSYHLDQGYAITLPDPDPQKPTYPHLTLNKITMKGAPDPTTNVQKQLPDMTFQYITENCCPGDYFVKEDLGHLFWARNGYGGAVGFHYDAAGGDISKWYRRVRAKRTVDGMDPNNPAPPGGSTPHEFKYFYDYRGATENAPNISKEVTHAKPRYQPYGEFRGFAWVRVQDPMGQVTDHYFNQDDTFRGKEWRTQVGKVDVFTDTMSVAPPSPNWTISGSVAGTTYPSGSANGVWQLPVGASVERAIPTGYTNPPGAYQRGNDGYDVASRFMVRKLNQDDTSLNFAGTWKLENTSGNGEYWGLQISSNNINGPKEFDATVIWAKRDAGGVLQTGSWNLSRRAASGRPYRLQALPVDTWYWVRLHTSPDGRYALELHRDDYDVEQTRPGGPPTRFGDYIMIKSGDVADSGGTIPAFSRESKWKFKQAVTSGDGNYTALIDDYSETRTIYGQTDNVYKDLVATDPTAIGAQNAIVNNDWALVGKANNTDAPKIRFTPVAESWNSKYGEGTEIWQIRVGKKVYGYDARYGNQTSLDEYGNVRFATSEQRSVRTSYVNNPNRWIIGKAGTAKTYQGIAGTAGSLLMAEVQNFYDGQTTPGVIPDTGKGNLTETRQVGVLNGASNSQTSSQKFRYDVDYNGAPIPGSKGNQTVTINPNGVPVTTTHDLYYQSFPVTVYHPNGRTETMTYDFKKDVISTTVDINGTSTGFLSDEFGRPTGKWTNGFGNGTSPNEKYIYSDVNLTSVTPPFRVSVEKKLGTTAGTNDTTWQTRWFDGLGRLVEDVTPKNPAASQVTVVHNTYTVHGQPESTSMPYLATGNTTTYVAPDLTKPKTVSHYDIGDRVTQVVNPDNTSIINNFMWPEASGYRDETGNLQKWHHLDGLGRTDWVQNYDYTGNQPASSDIHYTYDALDRLTKVQRDKYNRNMTTTLSYDALGRKSAMNDPSMGNWQYDYDAAGNMTVQRDALYLSNSTTYADHLVFFRYDKMNRLTDKYYGQAHYNSNTADVKYRYDNDLGDAATKFSWGKLRHVEVTLQGQGASKANGHGFEYDTRGLLVADVITTTYTTRNYTVGYNYDTGGRLASLSYPDPETTKELLTMRYNEQGLGLPQSLSTNKSTVLPVYAATYNERGQLLTLDQGTNSTSNDHVVTSHTYDAATTKRGWLNRTRVTTNNGATVQLDLNLTWSATGNLTEMRQTAGSAGSTTNPTFTNTYTYDGLHRLLSATSTNGSTGAGIFPTEQYTFDSTSRMKSRTIGGTTHNYTYPDVIIPEDGTGVYSDKPTAYRNYQYTYDAAGNQVTRTNTTNSTTQTRTFDAENRLVKTVEGGTTTEFVYDGDGKQLIKIVTAPTTTPAAVSGLKAEYYDNMDFTNLKLTRTDATVDFNWHNGSPDPSMGADTFSVRWTGRVKAGPTSGTHTFYTWSDDGVRLWVNGQLVVNNWTDHAGTANSGTISLQANQEYELKLEYYDSAGAATIQLWWLPPGDPDGIEQIIPSSQLSNTPTAGLKAEYYDNIDFTSLKVSRNEAAVDFNWGNGSPDASVGADTFSARWTGRVKAQNAGTYTFYTVSDDGVRLWVNGQQLVNNWTDHGPTENSGQITLSAGQTYDIKMEYYENGAGALIQLLWQPPGGTKQTIAPSQLQPPANAASSTLYIGNLYEEAITDVSDTTPAYTSYYMFGAKLVGMRRVNQADSSSNGQFRVVGDHLGSTTLVFNTSAPSTVVHRQYYKPYGEVGWQTGSSSTSIGFAGRRLNDENGLMYFGARYYDPILSHFVSADTTTPDPLNPIDYDKYLYARANPLRYVDPAGYGPEDYYVFVFGCVTDRQLRSGGCDPNARTYGEFEDLLYQEFLRWRELYGEKNWSKYGIDDWDTWRRDHVRSVSAEGGLNSRRDVERIRETLAGIPDDGGDIHLWGHSRGGGAILDYLVDSYYNAGYIDPRIASIAVIDFSPSLYQLPCERCSGGKHVVDWVAQNTRIGNRLVQGHKPLLQVSSDYSLFGHVACMEGWECYQKEAYYGRGDVPEGRPGPGHYLADKVRGEWHDWTYRAVKQTAFEDWFKVMWR